MLPDGVEGFQLSWVTSASVVVEVLNNFVLEHLTVWDQGGTRIAKIARGRQIF
jgi:hypothetical protein